MTRDDMYDLVLGAATIAIGYMLWKQHKAAAPLVIPSTVAAELANTGAPLQGSPGGGYTFDFSNLFDGVF
jgi:hypothetical protein